MAHLDSSDKTRNLSRNAFLDALYHGLDSALWLELRCIHPVTGMVKVLWMPLHQRDALLRQADRLNGEGYSIYFAPCPRRTRQGDAEGAALLPALWVDVDCDGDAAKRDTELARLRAFKPPPSILLNSGGGWHAFWLLSEPLALPDSAARERAAGLLRGLFLAFGADPKYVKSVASLMRIPDTINTKPERHGAMVTLIECAPERRYALAEFAWLETQPEPQVSRVMPSSVAYHGNGHAPLPKVTLDYLEGGARKGDRNDALFAAACQFRDAGYPQHEAEAQLLPRYLADAVAGEGAGREHEARGTIRSAYQGNTRDPLPRPTIERVKARITALESRCVPQRSAEAAPSAQEISEIVADCAQLEPLVWAEQRKRLKVLAGAEVKASDLDRQYQHARRELEKATPSTPSANDDSYLIQDGKLVYRQRRETRQGVEVYDQIVADWAGRITERITQVNDDGQSEHNVALELVKDGVTTRLTLPSELFGDEMALKRAIAARAGEDFHVRQGMVRHLVSALLGVSGSYPRRAVYRFMGWTELNGTLTYVAPGLCVTAQGAVAEAPVVELESRLRDYGLTWATDAQWAESQQAVQAAVSVFPKNIAPACLAFALLPVLQRFFPAAAPRPALQLVGTYQSGKSELAALLTSFYGRFSRDEPPAQWGDTVNTVEALGYPLANALYWVDDYKTAYADERTFTRFLQSYSRGMGRGRLTREAKLRQERPCRGLLLSTGETLLEGEASVLSRLLVLEVPPWEQRDPKGEALARAEVLRHALPGFTARLAAWVAAQVEAGGFEKHIEREFAAQVNAYRARLASLPGSKANTGRIVQNWAVLATAYCLVQAFLRTCGAADLLPVWQDVIAQSLQTVRRERASESFLNILSELVVAGQAVVETDLRFPREHTPGTVVVGYSTNEYLYLLPELALQTVNRVHPLRFTANAIAAQLREDGLLVPGNAGDRAAVQVRIGSTRPWVWRLRRTVLSGETETNGQ